MTTIAAPETAAALCAALFAPRSVALVGASADRTKASSRPLEFLRGSGFTGRVYPINSRVSEIDGEPCWPSLAELPEVPDHVFLMIPTAAVADAVRDCGRLGVPVVTILSGGFAEAGPDGARQQRELAEVAATHGTRLLGPSSLGLVNTRNGLTLTANAAFAEKELRPGGVFVASQSGSLIGALLSRGTAAGLGFSHLVSVGGEADLSIGELCALSVDDPDVTGYLIFLENLGHAHELRRFARLAAARNKPVLVYKLGRSKAAAELAVSHTGALAGEDDVADAFFGDCGIARAHTLDGLLESLPLLARMPVPDAARAHPPRVAVVSTTGGGAAMVVDQLGVRGVDVVGPSASTLQKLAEAGAPAAAGVIVDLTLAGTRYEVMTAALEVMLGSGEFDLVVAVVGSSARHQPEVAVRPIVNLADGTAHSGLAAFIVPEAPQALAMLNAAGIPAFRTPESCADAIAATLARRSPRPYLQPAAISSGTGANSGATRGLDEAESYRLLAEQGIRAAPFVIDTVEAPQARWADLRYPVAVKALSAELAHKSDVGGVVLNVLHPRDVPVVAAELRDTVAERTGGLRVQRVLVQSMERGLGEVLVGYRVDPDVGPLVLVAMGGVLAEVYADRSLRMAPVDRATAQTMLAEVRGLAVLRGHRGKPVGDLDALADLVVAVSSLATRPEVAEAEINPVLVHPEGEGVLALDAVVRLWQEASR